MGLLKCPWGCGWEGPVDEYSEHYNECPARVCPKCGSTNIFFYRRDAIECLTCGNRWPRKKLPVEEAPVEAPPEVPMEEEELAPLIFKTEEEFRTWLEKHGLTAEPRPHTGLFKGDKSVGSYFETPKGFEVDLVEEAKTWLIRDKTFVEVEGRVEEALELPEEVPEEKLGG